MDRTSARVLEEPSIDTLLVILAQTFQSGHLSTFFKILHTDDAFTILAVGI